MEILNINKAYNSECNGDIKYNKATTANVMEILNITRLQQRM